MIRHKEEIKDDIREDIEKLREENRRLQKELRNSMHSIREHGSGRLHHGRERLESAMGHVQDTASDTYHKAYGQLSYGSKKAANKSREVVSQNPFKAILAAFVIGTVLSRILKRRG